MTDDPRAAAFEQALKQLEAWQTANDEAFEWCDYDMEIEASKRAFAIAAALLKAAPPAEGPTIEQAFKAGYHCQWIRAGHRYIFDPAMKPGDPDGAFDAWLAALPTPPRDPAGKE